MILRLTTIQQPKDTPMLFSHPISFSNFRSIIDEFNIPFSKKMTFLVGANNSGKSNVLRFLSILFNKSFVSIDEGLDFAASGDKKSKVTIFLNKHFILVRTRDRPNLQRHLMTNSGIGFSVNAELTKQGFTIQPNDDLFRVIPREYFTNQDFLVDFGNSSSEVANVALLINILGIENEFKGTVFVPNVRFITVPGTPVPHFNRLELPGSTISFSNVISELGNMDRPNQSERHLRSKLEGICNFIAYCLEKEKVSIQVPRDSSTILVSIDGNEQPISNLGTGVEQLIIIGLASYLFSDRLILIDEPELHLHPRAQKRLMKYLNENVDAQFVIATHSAAVLDAVDADVIRIENDGARTVGQTIENNTDKYRAVRDLGHSPSELIQSNFAIWVEGPSDRIYINHWIKRLDADLVEGIDYSVVFYGGRVLAQFSFGDDGADLVNAVSLSREFAVVIDSDKRSDDGRINSTKLRILEEVEKLGGFGWLTKGREVENYLPKSVIESLATEVQGVVVPKGPFDQVLDPEKVKKVDFARRATQMPTDEWPFDSREKMTELVRRISAAA
jgi:predicted ATPase